MNSSIFQDARRRCLTLYIGIHFTPTVKFLTGLVVNFYLRQEFRHIASIFVSTFERKRQVHVCVVTAMAEESARECNNQSVYYMQSLTTRLKQTTLQS